MSLAQDWTERVKELDAIQAPDHAYRDILSTAGKDALKRGETWRGRVMALIAVLEKRSKNP